jgi:ATP-dependent Lon protease
MNTEPTPDPLPADAPAETTEPFVAAPRQLSPLDQKIVKHFAGLVVRKDLTKGLKQNAVVPTYVLEYLLGQHCATDDNEVIKAGLESVQKILAKHYVHRNQAQLVKSTIKEKGRHKVIDKLTVELNDKGGFYEAEFTNLGLKKVPVSDDFVRRFPKLLVGGIWCITDVTYEVAEDQKVSPWQIDTLKPIQVAGVDYEQFLKARAEFTTEEWMDVLMQSMGFNPEMFGRRAKLLTLIRLIPYCERNYNLLELGPKGTGKSHIYAEFSPHGMLISGSEVTAPKLFVSNTSNGKIGLVGFWACVCFDEFAGKDKKVDKTLVDIMKNYMANRTFSRGIEQLTAEASMVFMGNTKKSVAYMLKHSHFFEPLPDKYIDSAFLDRIHAYNPGWEVAPIRHELFTNGYGFVVDYIAEVLKHLRTEDFTSAYKQHFEVTSEVSTRDQTGFEKTFSGLMKILFPDGRATPKEMEELLAFAMEARRRVREHILRIDETFKRHDFIYQPVGGGQAVTVLTPEELQYPTFAGPRVQPAAGSDGTQPAQDSVKPGAPGPMPKPDQVSAAEAKPRHLVVSENSKGFSFRRLFAAHLRGAHQIKLVDPYIRAFWQVRNFMEFVQLIHELTPEGEETAVTLITQSDPERCVEQDENLHKIQDSCAGSRVRVEYEYDKSDAIHARSITTDHGWKISLDRGLDIFQRYDINLFNLVAAVQEERLTKAFEVTYIQIKPNETKPA